MLGDVTLAAQSTQTVSQTDLSRKRLVSDSSKQEAEHLHYTRAPASAGKAGEVPSGHVGKDIGILAQDGVLSPQ